MKELDVISNKMGFKFKQILKSEYGYIYEVDTGNTKHYEIFEYLENTYYNCISYPGAPCFGLWAWTTMTLKKAHR